MGRQITKEELLSEKEWDALGLEPKDVLLTYIRTEEYGKPTDTAVLVNILFEKDGKFYVEESNKTFEGKIECVHYPLSEEETKGNIVSWLEDYDVYESQFSCDKNAHFEISMFATSKGESYILEHFEIDDYLCQVLSWL